MGKKPVIAVLGGAVCSQEIYEKARLVGTHIARQGGILICGGRTGVMEAACKGAREAQGLTIGILPTEEKSDANPYVDVAIATNMGHARNAIIVLSADAAIAIDGRYGTLSEIAFCLNMEIPLIGIETWDIDPRIHTTNSPEEAVNLAFKLRRK